MYIFFTVVCIWNKIQEWSLSYFFIFTTLFKVVIFL
jgi:hypothetical protein